MFSFGKNKTEARIVGEFYTNAIHVMEGAALLSEGAVTGTLPQCGEGMDPASFKTFSNYVALPPIEAFRIEYWAHGRGQDPPPAAGERAQPPHRSHRRRRQRHRPRGRSSGRRARRARDGRRPRRRLLPRASPTNSAHITQKEFVATTAVDIRSRDAIRARASAPPSLPSAASTSSSTPPRCSPPRPTASSPTPCGLPRSTSTSPPTTCSPTKPPRSSPSRISTAPSSSPAPPTPSCPSAAARPTTSARPRSRTWCANSPSSSRPRCASTASAPPPWSKAPPCSPATASAPRSPNTTFPSTSPDPTTSCATCSPRFYAKRTLTHQPIDPTDCAEAILFLAGPRRAAPPAHLIPVDGGLAEAFLR